MPFSLPAGKNRNFIRKLFDFCFISVCFACSVLMPPSAFAESPSMPGQRPAQTEIGAPLQIPKIMQQTEGKTIPGGQAAAVASPGNAELNVEARLTESGPPLRHGLQWRIYGTNLGLDNKLPLIAQSADGSAGFMLKPGDYIIFTAFGRAEQSKTVTLEPGKTYAEKFNLNAGGLKLNATLPDGKINMKQLHFAIYNEGQINEQKPLIDAVKAGEIIRLPAGSYHIVCTYGQANAVTRSDVRIEAGKLLEAAMQQRAAQIILKLVRQKGGEALADTSWAIMNDSGDIVREIANANAYIILAEGDYVAVAKNKDQIYQKEFSVSSGRDEEIEVPATPQNSVDEDGVD